MLESWKFRSEACSVLVSQKGNEGRSRKTRGWLTFGQVAVKVLFSVELGYLVYCAVERESHSDREVDGPLVEGGEHAGVPETDGAHVGVGRSAVLVLASAKSLGVRVELDVRLDAYHRLPLRLLLARCRSLGFLLSAWRGRGVASG